MRFPSRNPFYGMADDELARLCGWYSKRIRERRPWPSREKKAAFAVEVAYLLTTIEYRLMNSKLSEGLTRGRFGPRPVKDG